MRILSGFLRTNAVALLALFVALGGTSYAAVKLAPNSVKAKHIVAGAVGTSEVKDGSLLTSDFKAGQLSAGPAGATGPQGDPGDPGGTGPQGPPGAPGEDGRSALDTLEADETVRGFVGGDFQAAVAGGDWRAVASFAVPGSSIRGHAHIDNVTPGETCAGDVDHPTAPVDTLCIYPVSGQNPGPAAGSHTVSTPTKFGFMVTWTPPNTGDTYFLGTYAYTQAAL